MGVPLGALTAKEHTAHPESRDRNREKKGETEDLELDPTLPRSNMECPNCHGRSAVYFQDQSKRKITNM